jgi:Tfp pilus assembly protein PilN
MKLLLLILAIVALLWWVASRYPGFAFWALVGGVCLLGIAAVIVGSHRI